MDNQTNLMPGRYQGRIVACDSGAVGTNKTPLAKLFFKLEETGKTLPWTGWFSDKVNQKTGKTYTELVIEKLIECGFTGKCVSEMSNPNAVISDLFDTDKVWNLDIDHQTDKDGKKTEYFEVNWINDPEKTGTSKLDHVEAISVFKGMNLGGQIAKLRKGAKPTPKKKPVKKEADYNIASDASFTADDIPF